MLECVCACVCRSMPATILSVLVCLPVHDHYVLSAWVPARIILRVSVRACVCLSVRARARCDVLRCVARTRACLCAHVRASVHAHVCARVLACPVLHRNRRGGRRRARALVAARHADHWTCRPISRRRWPCWPVRGRRPAQSPIASDMARPRWPCVRLCVCVFVRVCTYACMCERASVCTSRGCCCWKDDDARSRVLQAALASSSAHLVVSVLQSHSAARLPWRCVRSCVRVCARTCVHARVHACIRACVRAFLRAWVFARVCVTLRTCECVPARTGVCTYVCACVCAFVRSCACTRVHASSARVRACMCVCVCMCLRVFLHICASACACMRACMRACVHFMRPHVCMRVRVRASLRACALASSSSRSRCHSLSWCVGCEHRTVQPQPL